MSHDRSFGELPAKNTVYTPYVYVWLWPTQHRCLAATAVTYDRTHTHTISTFTVTHAHVLNNTHTPLKYTLMHVYAPLRLCTVHTRPCCMAGQSLPRAVVHPHPHPQISPMHTHTQSHIPIYVDTPLRLCTVHTWPCWMAGKPRAVVHPHPHPQISTIHTHTHIHTTDSYTHIRRRTTQALHRRHAALLDGRAVIAQGQATGQAAEHRVASDG